MTTTTRSRSAVQSAILSAFFLISAVGTGHADSGSWLLNPVNGDWNNPANWSSGTVPGYGDTATFSVSNQTDITFSTASNAYEIVFQPDASSYQFTALFDKSLVMSHGGIDNQSGVVQTFIARGDNAQIVLDLFAQTQGLVQFICEPPSVVGYYNIVWINYADAGNATFTNKGEIVIGAGAGSTQFYGGGSSAGGANITNEAAAVAGASGGLTKFWPSSRAGNATITCEGATVAGAGGGITQFFGESHATRATLIAHGGSNGGEGGTIQFWDNSMGLGSHIEVFGNGNLDISYLHKYELGIDSLEGDGVVFLGSHRLAVRDNNLKTTFSGIIQDGGGNGGTEGSLSKIGTGTLTLTNANTYTGGTTIEGGKLVVDNRNGSGTGSGAVQVNAGILAGQGTIAGTVIVGTGSGAGAALAPGRRGSKTDTLTILSTLTFQLDSTYKFELKSSTATADKVVANGVTINSALFSFRDLGSAVLPTGTVFTAIDNTAATPIAGTFANLPDDSTFIVGDNAYLVDYQGGDGNDLTLTVVP